MCLTHGVEADGIKKNSNTVIYDDFYVSSNGVQTTNAMYTLLRHILYEFWSLHLPVVDCPLISLNFCLVVSEIPY